MSEVSKVVPKNGFKVIIAGGSIAGLTLAHAFAQAGIDYVLLEGRNDIAPQVGASIVLLPNGLRVMDQLGCYEDLHEAMEPLKTAYAWTDKGEFVGKTDGPELAMTRMGYPCAFLARQRVLQILYDRLQDKSKIHLGMRVASVDSNTDCAVVKTTDGTEYIGDVVVGADGVHSTVRKEMRRHADEDGLYNLMASDKTSMYADYNCVFGISLGVKGIEPGIGHRSHGEDCSTLCFVGQNDRVFWFFIKKMDKRYYEGTIPRFTRDDIQSHLQPHLDMKITDVLTVGALWDKISSVSFVSLEEAVYKNWTYGRIACAGDSIHKMTPNMGQGGNSAIESATVLANQLKRMLHNSEKPDLDMVKATLLKYQQGRQYRSHAITNVANELTRMEAMATIPHRIMALYVAPLLGDYIADLTGDTVIGAEKLEYLPSPPRSLGGHMPFDRNSGIGMKENKFVRALWALPLLGFIYVASQTMGVSLNAIMPALKSTASSAFSSPSLLGSAIPIPQTFCGIPPIDSFLSQYVTAFMPALTNADPASTMQTYAFLADMVPIQTIWMLESIRRANFLTTTSLLPLAFTVAYQFFGLASVAPVYYFLHYLQGSMENLAAIDNRLCNMNYVKTLLPALVLGYIVPTLAMFSPYLDIATRQYICAGWVFFPLLTAALHFGFAMCVTDTTRSDRMRKPEADMPHLTAIYAFAALCSASVYLCLWAAAPVGMAEIFFGGVASPADVGSLGAGLASAFRWDHILSVASTFLWMLLGYNDIKHSGRLDANWLQVAGVMAATTAVAGPGTAMVAMWAWRERILTKKLLPKD